MTREVVLNPQENVVITTLGDVGRLTVLSKTRKRIEIVNVGGTPPPDPNPIPPPAGENRITNGQIEDANGNASLVGWFQEENKVWFNTHTPLFECNKTHLIQGDRDFPPPAGGNIWKGGNPSSATIWTVTKENLPAHTAAELSWVCAHHMFVGSAFWKLYGRTGPEADYVALGVFDITEGVPLDKTCVALGPKLIPAPSGGYRQYRLLAEVELASDKDGVVFGDIKLILK